MAEITKLAVSISWVPMHTDNPFYTTQTYTGGYYLARFPENQVIGMVGTASTYAGALANLFIAATTSGSYPTDSYSMRTW